MINWFSKLNNSNFVKLIVFIGESNSGGRALNSSALSTEIEQTGFVKIWDNAQNNNFLNLKISDPGSNNLIGHRNLESDIGVTHGWELQLTNRAKNGDIEVPVYICKCGQGGTRLEHWVDDVTYIDINANDIFLERTNKAIQYLNTRNIKFDAEVFCSIGINDAIAATDPTVWKTKMQTFINNIRTQLGSINIQATQIMENDANYTAINNKIIELNNELSYFNAVQVSDATLRPDQNHWDYDGMKLIANRMIDNII